MFSLITLVFVFIVSIAVGIPSSIILFSDQGTLIDNHLLVFSNNRTELTVIDNIIIHNIFSFKYFFDRYMWF